MEKRRLRNFLRVIMRVTTSEGHSVARIYTPLMQIYLVGVKEEEWERRMGRGGVGEEDGEEDGKRRMGRRMIATHVYCKFEIGKSDTE